MIRSVIGGLPDPVVLLDRAGRALQFNVAAAELAPALRLGEPVQSALRTPEIIATLRWSTLYPTYQIDSFPESYTS